MSAEAGKPDRAVYLVCGDVRVPICSRWSGTSKVHYLPVLVPEHTRECARDQVGDDLVEELSRGLRDAVVEMVDKLSRRDL